jgi:hypothetical protein
MITLLQFLLFAALLFAVFFIKFNLDKRSSDKPQSSYKIEQKVY